MKRVVVDVDVGNDDAWALLILLKSEKKFGIKVEAITCVQGNTDVDNVANNVMRILTALDRLDVSLFIVFIHINKEKQKTHIFRSLYSKVPENR